MISSRSDEIGISGGQDLLGKSRIPDHTDTDDRNVYATLDCAHQKTPPALPISQVFNTLTARTG